MFCEEMKLMEKLTKKYEQETLRCEKQKDQYYETSGKQNTSVFKQVIKQ